MRKKIPTKQFNVRLPVATIELANAAAEKLELAQVDVVKEAIEMYARRKKISVESAAS